MKDYRVEPKIESDGSLTTKDLPFRAGERVHVIVHSQQAAPDNGLLIDVPGIPVLPVHDEKDHNR